MWGRQCRCFLLLSSTAMDGSKTGSHATKPASESNLGSQDKINGVPKLMFALSWNNLCCQKQSFDPKACKLKWHMKPWSVTTLGAHSLSSKTVQNSQQLGLCTISFDSCLSQPGTFAVRSAKNLSSLIECSFQDFKGVSTWIHLKMLSQLNFTSFQTCEQTKEIIVNFVRNWSKNCVLFLLVISILCISKWQFWPPFCLMWHFNDLPTMFDLHHCSCNFWIQKLLMVVTPKSHSLCVRQTCVALFASPLH